MISYKVGSNMKQNGIKSPDEIHELIELHRYDEALAVVKEVLKKNHFDLSSDDEYDRYTEYLQLRVTANGLIKQRDDAIAVLAHREREPHTYSIELGNNRRIKLIDKSILRFTCDAAVNSYHTEKIFDYSPKSFSREFIK
ncbi:MAG: hypothetical protein CL946_10950, partial [Ectothiorhodospiraceae bacterium]|nr:hypothetical protein [Ectothiorhodospiraceae bacterium]